MEILDQIAQVMDHYIWGFGIPVKGETIPFVVIALLGVGVLLTLRLGFIQIRRLGHGFAVTSGKYDDPNEPGDVSHFQALTTALSATVGIGNIAGVAIAIHWGGPGALFWMWCTALLGMATKYAEVTLAQRYRNLEKPDLDGRKWEGSVSGGPMYYIERGLGPAWKPLAFLFASILAVTAFFTGNAIQANTVADTVQTTFGVPVWVTGLLTTAVVGMVIIGGISRIGRVTGVLAPLMAAIYVAGALLILIGHVDRIPHTFALIFKEAFNPTAGVAGTGVGAVLVTMMWGVKRGLFSNEAGQGSAPIAHAAAKTDEPVSEGVVALVEPFIDTLVICSMTGLVIILTGVWNERIPTEIVLAQRHSDISYIVRDSKEDRFVSADTPAELSFVDGRQVEKGPGLPHLAWHEVDVERLFTDEKRTTPFSGTVYGLEGRAVGADGAEYKSLWGMAVENAAPLTMLAFGEGLGGAGAYVVVISVILFAVSTAISWSYYGDRCARYLLGTKAVLPYKLVYLAMHFAGAVIPLATIWQFGDIFLGIVILPNLAALVLLSGQVKQMTRDYFDRQPWLENAEAHKRAVAAAKAARRMSAEPE